MMSQRLRTILDPVGHTSDRASGADSTARKAVVWVKARSRGWVAQELRAAGVVPMFATSLRHVATSLQPDARQPAAMAIVELGQHHAPEASVLTTARWSGFAGAVIAVGDTALDARTKMIVGIDVAPGPAQLAAALQRR
ncbi:MAG TPA: hypothetical protein VK427_00540 [Kofleriaceae bacterium]|nr:hypothetical protein [Kofleriaceae bacterium]